MADSKSREGAHTVSFETHRPILLSIELSQATVHVIANDRSDAMVAVSPSDRGRQLDVEAARKTVVDLVNGILSIRMPKPGGIAAPVIGWKRSGSVEVTVELPEGSSLRADTGVADLRCDGRLGDVDVRSGVGDVRLDRTEVLRVHTGVGRVAVEEASGNAEVVAAGDMTLGTVVGDADIKNLNGKTWIGRVGGNVRVRSANGDVAIEDASRDVTVKTANGDIRVGRLVRGSATLETASGRLEIGIEEGTAAWVDASTKFGRIRNTLAPAEEPGRSTETVQVRAWTAFGDVLIARSGTQTEQGEI